MISSEHRFHGPTALRFVYKSGKTVRGPLLGVKSSLNSRRETYRLAVVVSRKVHKSAVKRNRMRRRLYAIVQELEHDITGPHDIVITVFNDKVLDEPRKSLVGQVRKQFAAAGILKNP